MLQAPPNLQCCLKHERRQQMEKDACEYMSAEDVEYEYMIDAAIAEEAYREYIESGCQSTPIAELWKELDLED